MATPGMKFGPCEILELVGAEGMAEVHRADDSLQNPESWPLRR